MQSAKFKILLAAYIVVILSLFFYSFTQVDLGLTLAKWSLWQVFQRFFQQIGFFQRPLSTYWYITILVFLFLFYTVFLLLAHKNKLTKKQTWTMILVTSTILLFAYNAFSYDLFNYIFDAKIVTFYHQNPYQHKALDYPGEIMLGFMHWTDRVYPYGPIWLLLTIPISFIGFQKLLLTIILFKGLAYISFLATTYAIGKIVKKIFPQNEVFSLVFFSLNPLILIESLVSAHNDIVMMCLALVSLLFILERKYIRGFLLIFLSIGVKFATVFLIPFTLAMSYSQYRKIQVNWQLLFILSSIAMIVPVIIASNRTNFQPWYALYVFPITALYARKYYVVIPIYTISVMSLLQYVPFLYIGNWDPPIPSILSWMNVLAVGISVILVSCTFFTRLLYKKISKEVVK